MGRNNLEHRADDYNWGYNESKKKPFKFGFLEDSDCRNLEVANGLEIKEINIGIRINGKADIELNDKLVVKGLKKIVIAITPKHDNPKQGRYKGNLDDYSGSFDIGLK